MIEIFCNCFDKFSAALRVVNKARKSLCTDLEEVHRFGAIRTKLGLAGDGVIRLFKLFYDAVVAIPLDAVLERMVSRGLCGVLQNFLVIIIVC